MGEDSNHVIDHQLPNDTDVNVTSICEGDEVTNHDDSDEFKPHMNALNANGPESGELDGPEGGEMEDLQKDGDGSNGNDGEVDDEENENEEEDEDEDEDSNQLSGMHCATIVREQFFGRRYRR
ncbi:acidic leucine-rich nuclear phosphoprotein 32 family member B-like [Rhopalosiphum maidis]|uniref:acidic leucine-rich nuclear phosphoprotein 32 family member B-like n=1 Tax=Rhopalosiphum maidis TaxID=43146 RepID=UPI000EFF28D7|nr:acidic leucine-rich nuclear phosphoprotein 32 family member B-like [Rhopalosiphum maidis]